MAALITVLGMIKSSEEDIVSRTDGIGNQSNVFWLAVSIRCMLAAMSWVPTLNVAEIIVGGLR